MPRIILCFSPLLFLAGCAWSPSPPAIPGSAENTLNLFSQNQPGSLPPAWEPLLVLKTKKPTGYQLIRDGGATVLHARAQGSASGLMQKVSIDPQGQPWLQWRWKVDSLVKTADNTRRQREDSPVRVILCFDGDKGTLPFNEQIMFETARVMTGRELPYATLMYIWENRSPVGKVIANTRTARVQKLVAESGAAGVGQWREFTRNIVEDYEKAFREKPGKLIGIGVMSDTDNTGETVQAWYGDIRLLKSRGGAETDAHLPR